MKQVVAEVLPAGCSADETVYHINPTGSFEIGGPDGDAGITGRKIIVDTYGGAAPHGGGAFSGKDPTKVDRSAAYAARYLAKNIVAAGLARRCTIQLAYAIGVSEPLSLYVDTHGTGTVGDDAIEAAIGQIGKLGGLTPRGIRTHSALNKPIYQATAAYGHFGRKPEGDLFPWEKTDLVDDLKAALAEVVLSRPNDWGGKRPLNCAGRSIAEQQVRRRRSTSWCPRRKPIAYSMVGTGSQATTKPISRRRHRTTCAPFEQHAQKAAVMIGMIGLYSIRAVAVACSASISPWPIRPSVSTRRTDGPIA